MSFCISVSQNSATCARNHKVTLLFTCSSSWNFWQARCFFKCKRKRKSLGARSGLWAGLYKTSQLKLCNNGCTALIVWVLVLSLQMLHLRIPCLLFWIVQLSLFSVSKYVAAFFVVPRGTKSTRRTPFQSQKTAAMIFLVEDILYFFFVGEWVWCHSIDCHRLSGVRWNSHFSFPVTMESRTNHLLLSSTWEAAPIQFVLWISVNIFGNHHAYSLW